MTRHLARLLGMGSQGAKVRTCSQRVQLTCHSDRERGRGLLADFRYSSVDPYAVSISFPEAGDVVWVVGRDLLIRGLTDPVGLGDVRTCPGIDDDGRAIVMIEFLSPEGHLVTEASTEQVYRFLSLTFAIVPSGTEHDHLDVDSMIDRLLDD